MVVIPTPGLPFFTVTSTSGQNVVKFLNPDGSCDTSTEVRWKPGGYPSSAADGTHLDCVADPDDTKKCSCTHSSPTDGATYYYAGFRGAGPGRFNTGRPPDPVLEPAVKWAFSTGAFGVTAPTVTQHGVIATCNDRVVYSMQRGAAHSVPANPTGGQWPTAAVAATAPIRLVLDPGALVRGRVLGADGKAVPGAYIVFWRRLDSGQLSPYEDWKPETDSVGRFEIRLPPGTYHARFYDMAFSHARIPGPDVTVRGGETTELEVRLP